MSRPEKNSGKQNYRIPKVCSTVHPHLPATNFTSAVMKDHFMFARYHPQESGYLIRPGSKTILLLLLCFFATGYFYGAQKTSIPSEGDDDHGHGIRTIASSASFSASINSQFLWSKLCNLFFKKLNNLFCPLLSSKVILIKLKPKKKDYENEQFKIYKIYSNPRNGCSISNIL